MIISLIIVFFCILLENVIATLPPLTFRLADNNSLLEFLRYLYSLDGLVPIHDGLIPVCLLYGLYYGILFTKMLVVFFVNVARGAGSKL